MEKELRHKVIIALGSNIEQESNINQAIRLLKQKLNDVVCTDVVWTEPIGVDSDMFLNCLLKGYTTLEMQVLAEAVKETEYLCGRTEKESIDGIIRIDIDVLQYDNLRFHSNDWQRNYIKELIKDL